MPPPPRTVLEALEHLCENMKDVEITEAQGNRRRMGDCEEQIDNIIKYLGLHADQHPEKDLEQKSIRPLRLCPGGRTNTR
jgi:hypothetical protein